MEAAPGADAREGPNGGNSKGQRARDKPIDPVLKLFRAALDDASGVPIEGVVLFGSRARWLDFAALNPSYGGAAFNRHIP
jgi:hypothetical protein